MKFLIVLVSIVAVVYVEACTNPMMPINGCCCPGYVLVGNQCCQSNGGSTCEDKINPNTGKSDCPGLKAQCNSSLYRQLMEQECPKTCGFCKPDNGGCVDKVNPSTGKSECASRIAWCNNSLYRKFMEEECPKTCGFC